MIRRLSFLVGISFALSACDQGGPLALEAERVTPEAGGALLSPSVTRAIRRVDVDFLGLMHSTVDCDGIISAFEGVDELSLGVLDKTFGTSTRCLERFLKDPRVRRVRIHLINDTCMRSNRACQPNEFMRRYPDIAAYNRALERRETRVLAAVDAEFRSAAARLGPLLRASSAACYISPALESNVSPRAGAALLNAAAKWFPNCFLVWNPVGTREILAVSGRPIQPGDGYTGSALVVHERHNAGVTLGEPCLYSNDGDPVAANAFGPKIRGYKQCRAQFYWTAGFNCAVPGASFIPPLARRACTTPAQMRTIVQSLLAARG